MRPPLPKSIARIALPPRNLLRVDFAGLEQCRGIVMIGRILVPDHVDDRRAAVSDGSATPPAGSWQIGPIWRVLREAAESRGGQGCHCQQKCR